MQNLYQKKKPTSFQHPLPPAPSFHTCCKPVLKKGIVYTAVTSPFLCVIYRSFTYKLGQKANKHRGEEMMYGVMTGGKKITSLRPQQTDHIFECTGQKHLLGSVFCGGAGLDLSHQFQNMSGWLEVLGNFLQEGGGGAMFEQTQGSFPQTMQ